MDLSVLVTLVAEVSRRLPSVVGGANQSMNFNAESGVVSIRMVCLLSHVRYSLAG